jgi:hypothetical protein
MAFEVSLDDGEEIEADINLVISQKPQLRLVLTSRAAIWPGAKAFALNDAVTTERVPLHEIERVNIGRSSKTAARIVGLSLLFLGLAGFVAVLMEGQFSKLPLLGVVMGPFIMVAGGRRRKLGSCLRSGRRGLKWTSPAAIGGGVNEMVDAVLLEVRRWSEKHGVNLVVSR